MGTYDELGRAMAGGPEIDNGRTIGVLRRQLEAALAERDEARAQQAALAEVLQAINAASGDFAPVFDLIIGKAMALCDAPLGSLLAYENQQLTLLAARNGAPRLTEYWSRPQPVMPNTATGRALHEGKTVQTADLSKIDSYLKDRLPMTVASVELGGIRTLVQVPLVGEHGTIGLFILYRQEVRPFTEAQIALVESFAAQATLAMENARRFAEQRESLEQQTATSEVLEVINASPGDLEPVFGAMLERAMHLCEAAFGIFGRFDGKLFEPVVDRDVPAELIATTRHIQSPPPNSGLGRLAAGESVVQLVDLADTDVYRAGFVGATALVDIGGARTAIFVALRKEGVLLGVLVMYRREVRAFSDKQVSLLQNFAAQAVIAMENARLLTEQREALEQQTATADILRVISQSPTDVTPVLDAVAKATVRLCEGADTVIVLREGDHWFAVAHEGPLASPAIQLRRKLTRETAPGRAILDRGTVHLADIQALDPVEFATEREISQRLNFRATVSVPMLRDGECVGTINLRKSEPGPFSPRQVALLESFAAQAVIALENTRLFTELREALDQQTATADILRVISQSPTDVQPVLDAVAKAAVRFCGALDAVIILRQGEEWRGYAHEGPLSGPLSRWQPLNRETAPGRAMVDCRTVHYPDIASLDPAEHGRELADAALMGFSAVAVAPLLRDSESIGAIALRKREAEPFTSRQIELLESFAAQAVIAIENVRLFTELRESLDQQTATAEILRVISQSPTDVQPVLDVVVKAAQRFCGADDVVISLRHDDELAIAAHDGPIEAPPPRRKLDRSTTQGRAVIDATTIHLPDISQVDPVEWGALVALSQRFGAKASLAAPMLREGTAIGAIMLRRREPGPFTERQMALLEAFAAQAVIAIENVRLFTELRESLDQQTATAEILRVISQSPTDVQPVLDAVAEAARRFCGSDNVNIHMTDGDQLVTRASSSGPEATGLGTPIGTRIPNDRRSAAGRAILENRTVHLPNVMSLDPAEYGTAQELARAGGINTVLCAPMIRDGWAIGVITLPKVSVEPFTPRQIALLEAFAAQAVIAIENVRLFTELQERTDDLTESLEYQTATSEVLEVISRSGSDIQPVLDKLVSLGLGLVEADHCGIVVRSEDGAFRFRALAGPAAETVRTTGFLDREITPGRDTIAGQALLERRVVHVEDVHALPDYSIPEVMAHVRTTLSVPLIRDGEAVGVINLTRGRVAPFSERQIALVKTFADQAVIAMENARLLSELTQRTDDLTESLDYQTATSEVLAVISRSPSDMQPVLEAMTAAAIRLCGAKTGGLSVRRGDTLEFVALVGQTPEFERWQLSAPLPLERGVLIAHAVLDRQPVQIVDVMATDAYKAGAEVERAVVDLGGHRTILHVPLMREDEAIGVLTVSRSVPEAFTDRQIGLIETFADQAVIAMENARLLSELRESLDQQTATAEILQVINASPGNLAPVFQTILEKAHSTCGADMGSLFTWDGTHVRAVTTLGYDAKIDAILREPHALIPAMVDLIAGQRVFHRVYEQDRADDGTHPFGAQFLAGSRIRTNLIIPLRKDDAVLGFISANRRDVRAYSDKEIALLENFAAQAVIAMENARLLSELRERTGDLTESLEYQTATSELLEVISRSAADLQPVLDTMLASAARLCGAAISGVVLRQGEEFRYSALRGGTPELYEALRARPILPARDTVAGHTLLAAEVVHVADVHAYPEYSFPEVMKVARTILGVPLVRESEMLGAIVLTRDHVEPFSDRQIELVRTFADQAVIAMENARLLGELTRREEELRVTFDHMGDGVAMFDAGLKLASWNRNFQELLDIPDAFLAGRPTLEDYVRLLVKRGELGAGNADEEIARYQERANAAWSAERTRPDGRIVEVRNNPVPGGGAVLIYSDITERKKAEAEIAAARDAAEAALERQTATADILKVIASSPSDTQPAFDAIAESANRLLGGLTTAVWRFEGKFAHLAAFTSINPEADAALKAFSPLRIADFAELAPVVDGRVTQQPTIETMSPAVHEVARRRGYHSQLLVPLLAQGRAIGFFALTRAAPGRFSDEDVLLLQTFADQGAIAIENARLFNDLKESLEQQTATSDILRVISQSPTDVQPVLRAVAKAAVRFCGAIDATIILLDGDELVRAEHEGPLGVTGLGTRDPVNRGTVMGRSIVDRQLVHVPDVEALDPMEYGRAREIATRTGWRSALAAPMLREGEAVGCILLRRPDPVPFTPRQIELLESFAAQAIIALENTRLFTELRDSLERLKAAQANLVQSEKMASLGQLTAGIAHEIKNPLNFVNNFAMLSVDLLDELKEVAGPALATLDADKRAELDETMGLLVGNLGKIAEHGKRADGIVKSMLSHSRGGAGDWAPADINALVEEALNLAYHGARASDKEFNVTLERDFEKTGKPIEVVPQDVTRVFLNLFGNGFYAANKRRLGAKQPGFKPTLMVSTRDLGDTVEVKVRDNGIGMPPEVKEKLFQPFFTTKPTGEGTGLGLSISYDIVTQQHGGTIDVESEPNNYTEFTVRLPRARRVAEARGT